MGPDTYECPLPDKGPQVVPPWQQAAQQSKWADSSKSLKPCGVIQCKFYSDHFFLCNRKHDYPIRMRMGEEIWRCVEWESMGHLGEQSTYS